MSPIFIVGLAAAALVVVGIGVLVGYALSGRREEQADQPERVLLDRREQTLRRREWNRG